MYWKHDADIAAVNGERDGSYSFTITYDDAN